MKNCFFLREDEIKKNTYNAISLISEFLQISIHETSKKIIAKKLSQNNITENKFKIKTNSTGHDNLTFFHHEHINPKSVYDKEYSFIDNLIEERYSNFFDSDGYLK